MPYVDLVSSNDYASIWYFAHTPNGNVGSFDPEKPTIVMLHPLFLDASWLYPQFDDQRLYGSYNLVAFDTRITGRSLSRYSGRHDLWVSAADLALAIQVRTSVICSGSDVMAHGTFENIIASQSAAGSYICIRALFIYGPTTRSLVSVKGTFHHLRSVAKCFFVTQISRTMFKSDTMQRSTTKRVSMIGPSSTIPS